MEKFNKFAENLMKVIVVPDETSDSVAPLQHQTVTPNDMFSNEVAPYMNDEEGGCGCGETDENEQEGEEQELEGSETEENESEEESDDIQVSHDSTGLKVQFNGMEVNLPNAVVQKIKQNLGELEESADYLQEETENEFKMPKELYDECIAAGIKEFKSEYLDGAKHQTIEVLDGPSMSWELEEKIINYLNKYVDIAVRINLDDMEVDGTTEGSGSFRNMKLVLEGALKDLGKGALKLAGAGALGVGGLAAKGTGWTLDKLLKALNFLTSKQLETLGNAALKKAKKMV